MKSRARSLVVLLVAVALGAVVIYRLRGPSLPAPGSEPYEQMTRAFYWGLSALEVGLLDDARQQFEKATTIVPEEPAAWADLGLAQLRLGELEAAAAPIERALALAPRNSNVIILAARMEESRGRLDEAVQRLREAVSIDPDNIRARFALADQLQRLNDPASDDEALELLDAIVDRVPANIAAQVERARIAARRGDVMRLRGARDALAPLSSTWPDQAKAQFAALQSAIDGGRFEDAARATTFLRNVLAPVPAFSEGLGALRTPVELIAAPFDHFLALAQPTAQPSPPDASITFDSEPVAGGADGMVRAALAMYPTVEQDPMLVGVTGDSLGPVGVSGSPWRADVSIADGAVSAIAAMDWNHDFRTDLVTAGPGGLRLLIQDDNGAFVDATAQAGPPVTDALAGVWAADIEMDGDIDIVAAGVEGPPFVMRNNGDGTWRRTTPFSGVDAVRAFGWADLDQDADADAVFLDRGGALYAFRNRQAGVFEPFPGVQGLATAVGMTVADLDADGTIDIVVLEGNGAIRRVTWRGSDWQVSGMAQGTARAGAEPGSCRVIAADLDNNGALDLVAPCDQPSVWLAGVDHAMQAYPSPPDADVFAVLDRDGDGRLDLAAIADGRPVWLMGRGGTAGYHWKLVRPRGQASAGDQRINSFGAGGEISVRSGLLVQTQVMVGVPVHFGLGAHTGVDVTRIVWPNGNAQAEFGTKADEVVVAEQRLKGSCPWVFAWDGDSMGFITDFLWRSPLGLRINARDTAGVTQTEDWVRIAGDQLKPHDGVYDVRITAELWETHFFDHVSLLVVDHPADTEMFVDERFRPAAPPALVPRALKIVGPVQSARDDEGRDVTDLVAARDGRYLATFSKGRYQGIARPHAVEFTLPDRLPAGATLVATGWIYPTDSSINVAIGQGDEVRPSGVALEAQDRDGNWAVVDPDVGFPAGKNKTMLIDLAKTRGARRLRLRTNLEIYWDALIAAEPVDAPLRTTRLAADADLRFRGFSVTTSPRGDAPETPIYARLASVSQRWRDLTGFHTRFGNVNALLSAVDDRYVIMNAGDELRLRFPAQPAPDTGWRRDFVLIGDGWEKDGDYNTGFSQTVLPLPSHDRPDYGRARFTGALEDDPVYQRHRSDWEEYHTRYVTPQAFIRGLRQPGS